MSRPVSYATADQARAYVADVLAAAATAPSGPAWIAMNPHLRRAPRWPEQRAALAALLSPVPLAEWGDVAYEQRAELGARSDRLGYLTATCRGLIVVALKEMTRRYVGPGVLAEVAAFTEARRPVLVFTGRRIVTWRDCKTLPAPPPARRWQAALVEVPAPPSGFLPTLSASLRVLGIKPVDPLPPMLTGWRHEWETVSDLREHGRHGG